MPNNIQAARRPGNACTGSDCLCPAKQWMLCQAKDTGAVDASVCLFLHWPPGLHRLLASLGMNDMYISSFHTTNNLIKGYMLEKCAHEQARLSF